ncbi:phosphate ABC transporter permease [Spiroplasma sabaudiense Ar-1343]|uniref:Phosphate ABC transporter permease n=1 Tax=Spiroplasma sabaudiense Ar-1343 TaxID=1276257 RepID=W6AAL0_9MOLU|nr:phosphate ABC transporter permease PstA [Spiroplasma sabaudiense]AHI54051.1 phosphate ABC transporter permease [Spiroplasma sabaudiense Ar-1343]
MTTTQISSDNLKVNPSKKNPKNPGLPRVKTSKLDVFSKTVIISITAIVIFLLIILLGFIVFKSIPIFNEFGFFKFIFTEKWQPGADNDPSASYGIWSTIISTLAMLIISLIFAVPLTIYTSLFICEYLSNRTKRTVITVIQLLAGIPSVVFGLFALDQIGPIFVSMGARSPGNLMTAGFTLAFMALPTMITLSINAIDAVPDGYRFAALGLGLSKEFTTFKVVRRSARTKIIGAIITGMARIIGETMAVILIAGNSTIGLTTNDGFLGFIFSSVRTLAGTIGLEMLENHGSIHESALYAIGLILFFIVIIINFSIIVISNFKTKKRRNHILKTKNPSSDAKETEEVQREYKYQDIKLGVLVRSSAMRTGYKNFYSFWKKFLMILATSIVISFTLWVILTVTIKGFVGFGFEYFLKFEGQKAGIFATMIVTIFLVLSTMLFAFPIALIVAIYLTEYASPKSKFTKVLDFSINVLASTPSIVFGVFGLTVFIVFFGLPMSIFASSLTMTIVILPTLITSFKDAITSVPESYREAAIGMGLSKTMTTIKVVIPNAMKGILTGSILAISRIIGESAPVYLTLGTAVRYPTEGFLSSGATMTTQIYMMAAEGGNPNTMSVAYQLALVTLGLVLLLNYISKTISVKLDPKYRPVKFLAYWSALFSGIFKHNYAADFKKFWYATTVRFKKFLLLFNFKRNKIIRGNRKKNRKVIKDILKEGRGKNDSNKK